LISGRTKNVKKRTAVALAGQHVALLGKIPGLDVGSVGPVEKEKDQVLGGKGKKRGLMHVGTVACRKGGELEKGGGGGGVHVLGKGGVPAGPQPAEFETYDSSIRGGAERAGKPATVTPKEDPVTGRVRGGPLRKRGSSSRRCQR